MSTLCVDNTELEGCGFIRSKANPQEITDAVNVQGIGLSKMGTSIPTPYARLFLFSSAFSELNHKEKERPSVVHDDADTNYHRLVSECLDMLEFVYLHGNDRKMEVFAWDQSDRQELMQEIGYTDLEKKEATKHKRLGEALDDAIRNTPSLADHGTIYLFRYNNVILGGTSPVSVFYTSPNWVNKSSQQFRRSGTGYLFDGEVQSLHQRGYKFRLFMHGFCKKYSMSLDPSFRAYLNDELNNYDQDVRNHFNSQSEEDLLAEFEHNNKVVTDTQRLNVRIGTMELYCANTDIVVQTDSDYLLQCTSARYKQELVNGEIRTVNQPLVLNHQGLGMSKKYWEDQAWSPSDVIPMSLPTALTDRVLPGFDGTKYPFLVAEDFLEDQLLEVSYNIHRKYFFTGTSGNCSFLLPLKKEFFKYFNIEDLLDGKKNMYEMTIENPDDQDARIVIVTLNLPLKGGIMKFVKEYHNDAIVDCWDAADSFDLAIFPFYRMKNGSKNIYNIMFGFTAGEKSLNFYTLDNLSTPLTPRSDKLRTNSSIKTHHICLESAFDLFTIEAKGATALVIPLMNYNSVSNTFDFYDAQVGTEYTFCVDFGTTNTQISYGEKGKTDVTNIKTLDITTDDLQTVLLNEPGTGENFELGFEQFSQFLTFIKTELMPSIIGSNTYKFPMRTAVCEVRNLSNAGATLFGTINIGFDYINEFKGASSNVYKTNLKWANTVRDTMSKERIVKYFEELMWIMKNKAVLNGARPDIHLVFTYPQSMRRSQVDKFQQYWDIARENVGAYITSGQANNKALTVRALEGVAPYYSFLNQLGYSDTYTNVDIGGGTSDIVYINKDAHVSMAYSAVFAANDLWGDGTNPAANKQNGFYAYYLASQYYSDVKEIEQSHLKDFVDNQANSSADIISFLFSKDNIYRFSDALMASQDMRKLMLIHFCSIIYYMGISFLRDEVDIPYHITFTGMGSKYISLLGSQDSVSDIIKAVLSYRLNPENINVPNIDVTFAEQPKLVTANGGVVLHGFSLLTGGDSSQSINPEKSLVYGWKDEEYSTNMISINDIDSKKAGVLAEFDRFLKMFDDPNFADLIYDNTEINCQGIQSMFMANGRNLADASFRSVASLQQQALAAGQNRVEEPMFFWPLKDALFQLGRQIAANQRH